MRDADGWFLTIDMKDYAGKKIKQVKEEGTRCCGFQYNNYVGVSIAQLRML